LYRRARSWRVVENLPSRPVNGDVLTPKVMRTVGSSISIRGSGSGVSGSASVSPMATPSRPVKRTMSPALALGTATRSSPRYSRTVTTFTRRASPSAPSNRHRVTRPDAAARDPPDGHGAGVVVISAIGDEHLESAQLRDRRRDVVDDRLEQRLEVGCQGVRLETRASFFGDGVNHRCLQLVRIFGQLEEQVVDSLQRLLRLSVGAVDLVDHHDDAQPDLKRLAQHKSRLRHRTFRGVDQEKTSVRHVEHPLHLAAKVRVARRVDDVDGHIAVPDRRVLGQDRDPFLTLQVVGVHNQGANVLVVPERVTLLEQGVDERRLAVVDVRDDRDVPDVVAKVG